MSVGLLNTLSRRFHIFTTFTHDVKIAASLFFLREFIQVQCICNRLFFESQRWSMRDGFSLLNSFISIRNLSTKDWGEGGQRHSITNPPAWIDAPTNPESLSLSELREKANAERGAERRRHLQIVGEKLEKPIEGEWPRAESLLWMCASRLSYDTFSPLLAEGFTLLFQFFVVWFCNY